MDRMTAVISKKAPEFVDLELDGENAAVVKKKIRLSDFIRILVGSAEKGTAGITVGRLPHGYYNASLHEAGFNVAVSVPPGAFPFRFFDEAYLIPFPRLLFLFSAVDGKLSRSGCFAAKDEALTDASELFHYPFANVGHDAHICFGSNRLPRCGCLSDVDALVNLFYGAPSNNDMWDEAYCGRRYGGLRIALEDLNGKDVFPTEILAPFNETVAAMLRKFGIAA